MKYILCCGPIHPRPQVRVTFCIWHNVPAQSTKCGIHFNTQPLPTHALPSYPSVLSPATTPLPPNHIWHPTRTTRPACTHAHQSSVHPQVHHTQIGLHNHVIDDLTRQSHSIHPITLSMSYRLGGCMIRPRLKCSYP